MGGEFKMKDYYKILGVEKTAGLNDIKKAYKQLAMKYHPDKNKEEPEETFKDIVEAYTSLSHQDTRNQYDLSLLDTSKSFFSSQTKVDTIHIDLNISWGEMTHSFEKTFSFKKKTVCKDGKTVKSWETTQCSKCQGSGMILINIPGLPILPSGITCKFCQGMGCHLNTEYIIVEILCSFTYTFPVGLRPGQIINFKHTGNVNISTPTQSGSISIKIGLIPSNFTLSSNGDIHTIHQVSIFDSIIGISFELIHPCSNEVLTVDIPGYIKPNDTYTIPREGVHVFSNLIIEFQIVYPEMSAARLGMLKDIFTNLIRPNT